MTKKNLKPQQVAPVQRETSSSVGEKGLLASSFKDYGPLPGGLLGLPGLPFAGDDAE